ncbi:MAG: hypothetical protein H0T59_03805 [Chloroflexi bacterium]|nr:hypothetical protein [Chloroflexota bacterium]
MRPAHDPHSDLGTEQGSSALAHQAMTFGHDDTEIVVGAVVGIASSSGFRPLMRGWTR